MNRFEIFRKVERHLLEQGRRAQSLAGQCMFRAPNGDRCAIGCLISDHKYSPNMEGMGVRTLVSKRKDFGLSKPSRLTLNLLEELQMIHDHQSVDRWAKALWQVAVGYGWACKVHPKYRALRAPTSKKPGCTCAKIWAQKKLTRPLQLA